MDAMDGGVLCLATNRKNVVKAATVDAQKQCQMLFCLKVMAGQTCVFCTRVHEVILDPCQQEREEEQKYDEAEGGCPAATPTQATAPIEGYDDTEKSSQPLLDSGYGSESEDEVGEEAVSSESEWQDEPDHLQSRRQGLELLDKQGRMLPFGR